MWYHIAKHSQHSFGAFLLDPRASYDVFRSCLLHSLDAANPHSPSFFTFAVSACHHTLIRWPRFNLYVILHNHIDCYWFASLLLYLNFLSCMLLSIKHVLFVTSSSKPSLHPSSFDFVFRFFIIDFFFSLSFIYIFIYLLIFYFFYFSFHFYIGCFFFLYELKNPPPFPPLSNWFMWLIFNINKYYCYYRK